MFDCISTAGAVYALYEYAKDEILETDFFDLTDEEYEYLTEEEMGVRWYMINPAKLKREYTTLGSRFIVSKAQKVIILSAVQLIKDNSADLPSDASFLERLLYAKSFLPPEIFTMRGQTNSGKKATIRKLY